MTDHTNETPNAPQEAIAPPRDNTYVSIPDDMLAKMDEARRVLREANELAQDPTEEQQDRFTRADRDFALYGQVLAEAVTETPGMGEFLIRVSGDEVDFLLSALVHVLTETDIVDQPDELELAQGLYRRIFETRFTKEESDQMYRDRAERQEAIRKEIGEVLSRIGGVLGMVPIRVSHDEDGNVELTPGDPIVPPVDRHDA